jgi:hypothetical protein
VAQTLEWQRAWVNNELGYVTDDDDLELLRHAQQNPDYYLGVGRKSHKPQPKRKASRNDRPYRLPFTIT